MSEQYNLLFLRKKNSQPIQDQGKVQETPRTLRICSQVLGLTPLFQRGAKAQNERAFFLLEEFCDVLDTDRAVWAWGDHITSSAFLDYRINVGLQECTFVCYFFILM